MSMKKDFFTVDSAVQVQPINHKGSLFPSEYKKGNIKHIDEN